MTWSKVFVLDEVVDWGFNLVVSDVDVVWFKDPLPLFAQHPHAGGRPQSAACSKFGFLWPQATCFSPARLLAAEVPALWPCPAASQPA
jgi:hypothetical protein